MPGAYAEYSTCVAAMAMKIPDALSDIDAATIEPLAGGANACKCGQATPGSSVLVPYSNPKTKFQVAGTTSGLILLTALGRLPSEGPGQGERQLSRIGVSQAQPEHGAGDCG